MIFHQTFGRSNQIFSVYYLHTPTFSFPKPSSNLANAFLSHLLFLTLFQIQTCGTQKCISDQSTYLSPLHLFLMLSQIFSSYYLYSLLHSKSFPSIIYAHPQFHFLNHLISLLRFSPFHLTSLILFQIQTWHTKSTLHGFYPFSSDRLCIANSISLVMDAFETNLGPLIPAIYWCRSPRNSVRDPLCCSVLSFPSISAASERPDISGVQAIKGTCVRRDLVCVKPPSVPPNDNSLSYPAPLTRALSVTGTQYGTLRMNRLERIQRTAVCVFVDSATALHDQRGVNQWVTGRLLDSSGCVLE